MKALALVLALGAVGCDVPVVFAGGFDYQFSLSASDTDPFANTGPPPAAGTFVLYLWLSRDRGWGGWSVAEMRIENHASDVELTGFVPVNGVDVDSRATFPDLVLWTDGCPKAPFLAGFVECTTAGGANGQLCLGEGLLDDVRGVVDCDVINPVLWPMDARGFGFGTDLFCDTSPIESASWGRTKAGYR